MSARGARSSPTAVGVEVALAGVGVDGAVVLVAALRAGEAGADAVAVAVNVVAAVARAVVAGIADAVAVAVGIGACRACCVESLARMGGRRYVMVRCRLAEVGLHARSAVAPEQLGMRVRGRRNKEGQQQCCGDEWNDLHAGRASSLRSAQK